MGNKNWVIDLKTVLWDLRIEDRWMNQDTVTRNIKIRTRPDKKTIKQTNGTTRIRTSPDRKTIKQINGTTRMPHNSACETSRSSRMAISCSACDARYLNPPVKCSESVEVNWNLPNTTK